MHASCGEGMGGRNRALLHRVEPCAERITAALRATKLGVERHPELVEECVDLHGIRPNDDATHLLLATCLECAARATPQHVDESADWQTDGGHAPPQQGALDLDGRDLRQQRRQVVEERIAVLATALHKDTSNARRFERWCGIVHTLM